MNNTDLELPQIIKEVSDITLQKDVSGRPTQAEYEDILNATYILVHILWSYVFLKRDISMDDKIKLVTEVWETLRSLITKATIVDPVEYVTKNR